MFMRLATVCNILNDSLSVAKVMIVAKLVEQLLPTPENRGSNPISINFYLLSTVLKRLM